MAGYATVSLTPRTIAWLVRPGDWRHLSVVVVRNCALVGGAANLLVHLEEDGTLGERNIAALRAYDPDLVVLAPDQRLSEASDAIRSLNPFSIISWDERDAVGNADPWSSGTGENAKIRTL